MKKIFITGRNATVPAKSQKFILKKKYCKEQNLLKQWKANFPKSQAVDLRCRKRYRYRWIWFQLTSQGKNWNSWRNSVCYRIPLVLWNWRSVLLWKRALAIFKDRMSISMDPIFFLCLLTKRSTKFTKAFILSQPAPWSWFHKRKHVPFLQAKNVGTML